MWLLLEPVEQELIFFQMCYITLLGDLDWLQHLSEFDASSPQLPATHHQLQLGAGHPRAGSHTYLEIKVKINSHWFVGKQKLPPAKIQNELNPDQKNMIDPLEIFCNLLPWQCDPIYWASHKTPPMKDRSTNVEIMHWLFTENWLNQFFIQPLIVRWQLKIY